MYFLYKKRLSSLKIMSPEQNNENIELSSSPPSPATITTSEFVEEMELDLMINQMPFDSSELLTSKNLLKLIKFQLKIFPI